MNGGGTQSDNSAFPGFLFGRYYRIRIAGYSRLSVCSVKIVKCLFMIVFE